MGEIEYIKREWKRWNPTSKIEREVVRHGKFEKILLKKTKNNKGISRLLKSHIKGAHIQLTAADFELTIIGGSSQIESGETVFPLIIIIYFILFIFWQGLDKKEKIDCDQCYDW